VDWKSASYWQLHITTRLKFPGVRIRIFGKIAINVQIPSKDVSPDS